LIAAETMAGLLFDFIDFTIDTAILSASETIDLNQLS
jgi:hypothetical protein